MVHRLDKPFDSPRRLSQSVLQAAEMLGLVRAEVGRILGFRCEGFSALYAGKADLEEGTAAWNQGVLFVRLYQMLFDRFDGDGPQMIHWLRRDHPALGASPFLLIVDQGQLAEVLASLEAEARPTASTVRGH